MLGSVGRGGPRQRELELALRRLREAELELAHTVLRGSALARTPTLGPRPPSCDLLRDDGANGSERQALDLGLELHDCFE